MSIEVGDAVLKFLGDSTQLDTKFDEIGPKAARAFDPAAKSAEGLGDAMDDTGKKAESAADDIEDAGKRTKTSMREASGEVALLGEEFGVRLPRHVRSFVAELPGVGTALEAAFSATAILFIAQALVQASDKLSKFLGDTIIFTSKMREQTAELIKQNIEIAKQSDLYSSAAAELTKLSDERTPLARLTDQLKSLNDEYDNLVHERAPEDVLQAKARRITEEIKLLEKEIALQKEADEKDADKKALAALKEQIGLQKDLTLALVAYHQAEYQGQDKSNFDEVRYQVKLKALQEEKAAEEKYNKDNLAGIERLNNQIKTLMVERGTEVQQELNKERETLNNTLRAMEADVKATAEDIEIIPPQAVQNILIMQNAAHSLGITLRSDLVSAVNTAVAALNAYKNAGGTSTVVTDAFKKKIAELEKQLDNFGLSEDRLKVKTETTWAGFKQDLKQGADATHELSSIGTESFNDLSKDIQGAFQSIVLGQQSVGKALEEALAQSLSSIAAQAAVKALFYTAEGFAALAGFEDTSAGQYFAAAGEMAVVAVAAGVAGRALSGAAGGGGGSSSGSNAQGHNSESNTGQSNRSGGSSYGVQAFADGGLVTGPTLAIIGEDSKKPNEAVLPLDDPRAMAKVGQAIGEHGGGTTHNWHIDGLVSADHLVKIVGQINKMVNKGQVQLTASNSLRLTKRSA